MRKLTRSSQKASGATSKQQLFFVLPLVPWIVFILVHGRGDRGLDPEFLPSHTRSDPNIFCFISILWSIVFPPDVTVSLAAL